MTPQYEPLMNCGTCLGRGWIDVRPGLSRPCQCRTRPEEAA